MTFSYSLEELIEHPVINVLRPCAVQLGDLIRVRAVRVQRSELAARVSEQHEEVLALGARNLLEHTPLRLRVHRAREHAVLHRVQHDAAVGLGRRLLVQPWPCNFDGVALVVC